MHHRQARIKIHSAEIISHFNWTVDQTLKAIVGIHTLSTVNCLLLILKKIKNRPYKLMPDATLLTVAHFMWFTLLRWTFMTEIQSIGVLRL